MWATAPPHSATRAYCDIDEAALARGVAPLFSCGCYEDATGAACELPVRSVCLNQCNAPQGVCVRGWCRCAAGFGGADCSIALPALAAPREVDGGSSAAGGAGDGRRRLRPSVFVYDLPSEFNSWTAETRMTASDCVYRRYKEGNETVWENYAFGLELALHEAPPRPSPPLPSPPLPSPPLPSPPLASPPRPSPPLPSPHNRLSP